MLDSRMIHLHQWSFPKLTTMGTPKLKAKARESQNLRHQRHENRSVEGAERGGVSPRLGGMGSVVSSPSGVPPMRFAIF